MDCDVVEESVNRLAEYGEVPIRFEVHSVYEIHGDDPDSATFVERPVARPWVKDYDAIPTARPAYWPCRWDLSNWGVLAAYIDGHRVGGCTLACRTRGLDMLEGRDDLTELWDIRVHPEFRGAGVGYVLFDAARHWATDRNCRELKIETQNINVPACRFYQRQGCRLTSIDRGVYREFPHEIQLIWRLTL